MTVSPKLSSDQRRSAIVHAVRRLFAEKGFHGTTTRALAEAAGVSEALLFKHFPTKEALYVAMQLSCCTEQDLGRYERIGALEPSASTLVLLVHFLVSLLVDGCNSGDELAIQQRLMLRSLAEDGEFRACSCRDSPPTGSRRLRNASPRRSQRRTPSTAACRRIWPAGSRIISRASRCSRGCRRRLWWITGWPAPSSSSRRSALLCVGSGSRMKPSGDTTIRRRWRC